jgi:hypothetical protein
MMKHTLTATALAIALATPAFAQSTAPMAKPDATQSAPQSSMPSKTDTNAAATTTAPTKTETFVQAQDATDWRGSKLIGANVYGQDNKSIGEINDLIVGNDGSIKAAVIGVGGFLGVGEKNVAVSFDQLSVQRKPNSNSIEKITVNFTKDQLKNAPKFAYYEAPSTSTTGSGSSMSDKAKTMNPMGSPKK